MKVIIIIALTSAVMADHPGHHSHHFSTYSPSYAPVSGYSSFRPSLPDHFQASFASYGAPSSYSGSPLASAPLHRPSYYQPTYIPKPSYAPEPAFIPTSSYEEPEPVLVQQPSYPSPQFHHHAHSHSSSYDDHEYDNAPASYNYGYGVNDHYAGLNFGQQESREGHVTRGSYHVQLPDGRLQTVNYYVDPHSGYVADVSYSGVANYDATLAYEPRPTYDS